MTDQSPTIDQLLKNLDHAMLADRHRLAAAVASSCAEKPDEDKLAQWVARMQASCVQVTARRAQPAGDSLRRQPADRRQARRDQGRR